MFKFLRPQQVEHSEGYLVQTKDRHTIQYIENGWVAEIGAEFGPVSELFGRTLKTWTKGGREEQVPEGRRIEILERARAGLSMIMRGPVEIKGLPASNRQEPG